ncbi:chalcone isomerase family protein [Wenzhouxiangella sp. EGI_FJ10305]|uniref:chalcone isomerase family protein n=1 Tax=Wenzhouxiangella sp. EGI_FJ10305 TaxID=3243768 RepID=UPI0035D7EA31
MTRSIWLILLLAAASTPAPAATAELERCSEVELKVIGLFSVGTASLHLADCGDAGRVLEPVAKQFSLKLDRDMAGKDLIESANELLVENLDDVDNPDQLPEELACLANAYVDASDGERFDVVYEPEERLALYRDDELLTECPDQGRGHEYFKIWFGEEPFNDRMKKRLLERASGN